MSERAGFKFKLNKKPKNFNNKEEAKRSDKNGGVFSENSYSKTRKLKDADDGRRNRVGSGKLTSFKIHKNSESTHRRVSSEKHSKNFKGDLKKGRRSYGKASLPLEDVTSTSRNPKKVGRSVKTVAETDSSPIEPLKKDDTDANVRAKWTKRIGRDRKTLKTDSEVVDDKPKKKKRVIRLDPYDTSNKRLDDGIAIDESKKDKKKDLEENGGISKNAQFRGIQPSPSIISYVEDNLLGRRRTIEIQRAGYNTELPCPLDNTPFSTNSERERIEENIFRNKLQFFAAAKVSSSFPPPDMPEIAFAGRSNVGKSSLLNALTRQWGVVRTSDKPGHTQSINFFELGSKLCLVDLPGYGFAYAKEEVKEAWEDLVKEYVSTRVGLKRVCLLIDTKWGMKPRDNELIDLMERSQTRYQIVLTKTDTVFPMDVARRAMQIEENLKANRSIVQPVMMASSKSGAGIGSLRTVLSKIARFAKL